MSMQINPEQVRVFLSLKEGDEVEFFFPEMDAEKREGIAQVAHIIPPGERIPRPICEEWECIFFNRAPTQVPAIFFRSSKTNKALFSITPHREAIVHQDFKFELKHDPKLCNRIGCVRCLEN